VGACCQLFTAIPIVAMSVPFALLLVVTIAGDALAQCVGESCELDEATAGSSMLQDKRKSVTTEISQDHVAVGSFAAPDGYDAPTRGMCAYADGSKVTHADVVDFGLADNNATDECADECNSRSDCVAFSVAPTKHSRCKTFVDWPTQGNDDNPNWMCFIRLTTTTTTSTAAVAEATTPTRTVATAREYTFMKHNYACKESHRIHTYDRGYISTEDNCFQDCSEDEESKAFSIDKDNAWCACCDSAEASAHEATINSFANGRLTSAYRINNAYLWGSSATTDRDEYVGDYDYAGDDEYDEDDEDGY